MSDVNSFRIGQIIGRIIKVITLTVILPIPVAFAMLKGSGFSGIRGVINSYLEAVFEPFADSYDDRSRRSIESIQEAAYKVREFLRPQLVELERRNLDGFMNDVTVAYISHLTMMAARRAISIDDVKVVFAMTFDRPKYRANISNAFFMAEHNADYQKILEALFERAKNDFNRGSGDFLVKYTEKASNSLMNRDANYQPSLAGRTDYLNW